MRIGIISTLHNPAQPPFAGGIEATSYFTAELLARNGHEVYLFQTGDTPPANTIVNNVQLPHAAPTTQPTDSSTKMMHPPAFENEDELAGQVLRDSTYFNLDVLINCSNISSLIVGNHLGFGVPQVVWLQLPRAGWPPFTETLKNYAHLPTKRYSIFAQTGNQRASYVSFDGIPVDEHQLLVPISPKAYTQSATSRPSKYLLWAGRPEKEKGFDRAIATALALDMPLNLMATSQTDFMHKTLNGYQGRDSVKRLINVDVASPHDKVLFAMQHAAALLFPSQQYTADNRRWDEPGSRVITESLLQGCPVVAPAFGCVAEWIRSGVNGVVAQDGSAVNMAKATETCLDLQTENPDFRQNIQELARNTWNEDKLYRSLIHAIQKTLKNAASSR